MAKRKSLSKSVRFEVFKRDSFKCQYCGRSAPDVVLHADHMLPVSKGGKNDIVNLITSCQNCNLGKSNRLLSDDSIIKQQKKQLDELQKRREQLEMMMTWQRSLLDLEQYTVTELANIWSTLVPGYGLSESGLSGLKRLAKKYNTLEIIESMKCSASQYLAYQGDGKKPTPKSVNKAYEYIEKICRSRQRMKEKPYLRQLYYARGILKNRLSYVSQWESVKLMEAAFLSGHSTDGIINYCKEVSSWTTFKATMKAWAEEDING